MSNSTATATARSGGISAFGLLGVAFVVLKLAGLTEVAQWSWVWVLCPFWIGLAVFVGFMLLIACGAGLFLGGAALLDWRAARKRRNARR